MLLSIFKNFLRPYVFILFLAFFALILSSFFYLALPISIRYVFDTAFDPVSSSLVQSSPMAFYGSVLVCLGFALTSAWRFYLVSWLGERVVADLRSAVFAKVLTYEMQQFESLKLGEILSRLTADTVLIEQMVGTSMSMALRNSISLLGGLVMIFYTSWRLSLLVLILLPVVLLPLIGVLRWTRRLSRQSQDAIATTNAYAGEVLQGLITLKVFGHHVSDSMHYNASVEDAFTKAKARILVRSLLTVIVVFVISASLLTVLWFGLMLLHTTPPILTSGALAQFLAYAVIVAVSFAAISEVWGDIERGMGASERLLELLEQPGEKLSVDTPEKVAGDIHFKNCSFCYPSRPTVLAIEGFSLTIKQGQTVAFVGQSGAGKSTLLQLLLRLYPVGNGTIFMGDKDINNIEISNLRAAFSMVPQDVQLFSGSVFSNIAYGSRDATKNAVFNASKMALVDDFVKKMPYGYDTLIGERGMKLSGGQKQRISIARAFLRDAPYLLLDEATSSLDAKNESQLHNVLQELTKDRTTLIIAHRLSTVKNADKIVFMEKGRIIDEGSHTDLMKKSHDYAQFVKYQLIS